MEPSGLLWIEKVDQFVGFGMGGRKQIEVPEGHIYP
jgi:hypothetical protein